MNQRTRKNQRQLQRQARLRQPRKKMYSLPKGFQVKAKKNINQNNGDIMKNLWTKEKSMKYLINL